jgi:hypothetical protein
MAGYMMNIWDTKRRLSKKNYYKQKFGGSHEAVKDEIVKRLNTGTGNIRNDQGKC